MRRWLFVLVALCCCVAVHGVDIAENTTFTPGSSNVTYVAPFDFNCTSFTVGSYCLNITGGNMSGNYCTVNPSTVNIELGTAIVTVNIYDQQLLSYLTWRNVTLELIEQSTSSQHVTDNGNHTLYNVSIGENEIKADATDYYTNNMYFTPDAETENTVNMYMLNSSEGTRVIHILYDQDSSKVEGITIHLMRWYSSTNSFNTVQMAKTNFEGRAALYVELYDTYYRLRYSDGNVTYKVTNTTYWFETETEDTVNLEDDLFTSWRGIDNGYHNISFVNSSGQIYAKYQYYMAGGLVERGCLEVQRLTLENRYNVCNNCTTSSAAILTCKINHTLSGEYKAVGYIDTNTENSPYTTVIDYFRAFTSTDIPRQEGIFLTAILVGTFAMVGLTGLTGSFVLMFVAIIFAALINLAYGIGIKVITFIVLTGLTLVFMLKKVKA